MTCFNCTDNDRYSISVLQVVHNRHSYTSAVGSTQPETQQDGMNLVIYLMPVATLPVLCFLRSLSLTLSLEDVCMEGFGGQFVLET